VLADPGGRSPDPLGLRIKRRLIILVPGTDTGKVFSVQGCELLLAEQFDLTRHSQAQGNQAADRPIPSARAA
jgi:hypothetical protein